MRNKKQSTEFSLKSISALNSNQERVLKSKKNLVLSGYAGTGKAQPATSKIKTPFGWTNMKNINVGDLVTTPSNTSALVLNKYYHSNKNIFKIKLHDGRVVEACDEHLWPVYLQDSKTYKVINTLELAKYVDKIKSGKVYIPLTNPIDGINTARSMPIHPYILGALIGDGCFRAGNTIKFTNVDADIIERINNLLPEDHYLDKVSSKDIEYSLKNLSDKYDNKIKQYILDVGLLGCKSDTKFIPEAYMNMDIPGRLELLKGLFDTDGTIENTGGLEYSTTSSILANQVAELIYSLGGTCSITERMGKYKDTNGVEVQTIPNYRVRPSRLSYDIRKELFFLSRKKNKVKPGQYDNVKKVRVVSVDFSRVEECWCIEIDSEDKLYLTDNYVVTHNTYLASYLAYDAVFNRRTHDRIVYMRSAVPTRNIGFLPGTDKEKVEVYEAPYTDIATELFGRGDSYDILKKRSYVEFMSTSFVRGITLRDAFIIVDECQNMTYHELDSIISRLNDNCRIAFCGDIRQADLFKNGLENFYRVLRAMDEFDFIEFGKDDIVRSELVRNYIITKDEVLGQL